MDLGYDTDTVVFHALRVYRNAFIGYCRTRLAADFGEDLDGEIRTLFKKEWEDIERSARQAHETGFVERQPIDALDHLSVNHTATLIEKYWALLCPFEDAVCETSKKARTHVLALARDLIGVRNPVAHGPEEALSLRDALRYLDSAVRVLDLLGLSEADDLRDDWSALVDGRHSDSVRPPAILDTLPSREVIATDFIGRLGELAELWRWLGDDTRRMWALVGDGGKGKTTIAYEFAVQARSLLSDFGLQGVLWLTAKRRRFVDGETVPTVSADFDDLESALDWVLTALGWTEDTDLGVDEKLNKCMDLLREFPMLIVADDIDSLDKENEQAVEFFVQHVPQTGSKALITSRREVFGLGSCTTVVAGMSEAEVREFVTRRASAVGLDPERITAKLVRQIRDATDGSPLYIEDLLRLAHFYSLDHALAEWSGRRGDPAREYALKVELERLSGHAKSVLGVLAYSDAPLSLQECAVIVGLTDDQAETALGELRGWNLLARPGLVEDVPRFACSRNLSKLMLRTLDGTDLAVRIRNGLNGLRGIAFGSARVRQYIQQAVALKQRGSQVDAEETLRRGLEEVPNSGEIHAMLGWLFARWKPSPRYADAVENFKKAEALGSWGRDLYAHWADMELGRDEVRNAVAICERSLKSVAKEDPFTWRLAGVAYTKLGRSLRQTLSTEQADDAFAKADSALRNAQTLSVTSGDLSKVLNARYQLAKLTGQVDAANQVRAKWEQLLPSDPFLAALAR